MTQVPMIITMQQFHQGRIQEFVKEKEAAITIALFLHVYQQNFLLMGGGGYPPKPLLDYPLNISVL